MSFGTQLRRRREELRLSRAQLAEELGVSPSAISNYENGVSSPKEDVLLRLFDALQIDPNYLYRGSFRSDSFAFTYAEQKLIERCRSLSPLGRQTVHSMVSALCSLHEEAAQEQEPSLIEPRRIPLYRSPAAAGFASPVLGEDFDYITADGDVPPGAEFAVRIQGDSMEPFIHDGGVVFVNHDPLAVGDAGIFCVDGDMLCKQYCRDASGTVYLFSLNRARSDADVLLTAGSGRSLVCFGRVMLPHRLPLPAL